MFPPKRDQIWRFLKKIVPLGVLTTILLRFSSGRQQKNKFDNVDMNFDGNSASDGGQDTNGNPAGANLGARPKVRRSAPASDQVVPNENRSEENDDLEDSNSDDDFYIYR